MGRDAAVDAEQLRRADEAAHGEFSGGSDAAVAPCPADRRAVEIELRDERGAPLADVAFVVQDAEGTRYRGATTAKGELRLDGLAEGSCSVVTDPPSDRLTTLGTAALALPRGAPASPVTAEPSASESHTVEAGECLTTVAARYLCLPETLADDPRNAALREKGRGPHVLVEGDTVWLPSPQTTRVSGRTGARLRLQRQALREVLRVRLTRHEPALEARANASFLLELRSRDERPLPSVRGTADGEGRVEVPLPLEAWAGALLVRDRDEVIEVALQLGTLLPVDDARGVVRRLRNAGYLHAPDGDASPERVQAAIEDFQFDYGLVVNGRADDATRRMLVSVHRS